MVLNGDFLSEGTLYSLIGLEVEEPADSGLLLKCCAYPQNVIQEEDCNFNHCSLFDAHELQGLSNIYIYYLCLSLER